jgi:hypothetical protein
LLIVLISKARDPRQLSSYVKHILPEAVELGVFLLHNGIPSIQDDLIRMYYDSVRKSNPGQYFLIAIRNLIREGRKHAFTLNTDKGD